MVNGVIVLELVEVVDECLGVEFVGGVGLNFAACDEDVDAFAECLSDIGGETCESLADGVEEYLVDLFGESCVSGGYFV